MTKPLPWPGEAAQSYWTLRRRIRESKELFSILAEEPGNLDLLARSLPHLEYRIGEVDLTATEINATRSPYWPNWALESLENIIFMLPEIRETLKQIKVAYNRGNISLLDRLVIVGRRYCQRMERNLINGRPPEQKASMRELINNLLQDKDM